MLSRKVAEQLRNYRTPFYLYDIDLLRQTLQSAVSVAERYHYVIHYAIKANFDPRILQVIREYGLGIDCASGNEVRCAIEAGFDPKSIVYAGVGKRDHEIRYAVEQGIFAINCESMEELAVIDAFAAEAGKVVDVGLRINPDIDPKTNHCIDTGQADSKFGISYEEVLASADKIKALSHVRIRGMHLHIGSQIRELHVFEYLCNKVNVIVENLVKLGFELDFVDVGGGLGINYEHPNHLPIADFQAYFDTFKRHLRLRPGQALHFELGRSLVAPCGTLICRVLYVKQGTTRQFAIVDGSMTELIRPALYHAYHRIENLTSNEPEQLYDVVGPVCESSDVFAKGVSLDACRRGDFIAIRSAGAYGESMASTYNGRPLPGAFFFE